MNEPLRECGHLILITFLINILWRGLGINFQLDFLIVGIISFCIHEILYEEKDDDDDDDE